MIRMLLMTLSVVPFTGCMTDGAGTGLADLVATIEQLSTLARTLLPLLGVLS